MTFSIFSVAILFILASSVIKEVRLGIKGGFVKALISFLTLLISLIMALVFSPKISAVICEEVPFIANLIGNSINVSSYDEMRVFVNALAAIIVSSFFFLVILGVMRVLFSWFASIAYKRKNDEETEQAPSYGEVTYTGDSKKWGAFVGALTGIFMAVIITAPIMGTINVAKDIVGFVERADKTIIANESVKSEVDSLRYYANDGVGMVLYNMGGSVIYNSVASTTVRGETVYLVNEISNMRVLLEDFLDVYPILQSPKDASSENMEGIDRLCEHIYDIKLCDIMISVYLPDAARAWLDGNSFLKIPKPSLDEVVMPVFDSILEVCSNTGMYSVKQDMVSLLKVYAIIIESGILDSANNYTALVKCIDNYGLFEKLLFELDKNPNMDPVKREINRVALSIVSERLYLDNFSDAKRMELSSNIADAINSISAKGYGTYEEKVNAMTEYAKEYFNECGINVPDSVAAPIAGAIIEEFSTSYKVSADMVETFFQNNLS